MTIIRASVNVESDSVGVSEDSTGVSTDTLEALCESNDSPYAQSTSRSVPYSESIISGLIALSDGLIIFFSGLCLYLLHPGWGRADSMNYFGAMFITVAFTIVVFYFARLYLVNPFLTYKQMIRKVLFAYTVIFMGLITFTFALKHTTDFSRIWVFSWFISSALLISLGRFWYQVLIHKWSKGGHLTRNIAIVGAEKHGARLVGLLNRYEEPWIRIVGIFDDRISRVPTAIGQYPVVGNLDDLIESVQKRRIDDVLVALPGWAEQRTLNILRRLKEHPVHVRLCPDMVGFNFLHHGYSFYGGLPVLNVASKPLDGWSFIIKVLEDRVLGTIIFILTLPLMLAIAVMIKLDSPGPVIFRQKRHGYNNQIISVLKFRSLYTDKDDANGDKSVTRDDPRVTRIGSFLRRTSLDELPQIFNVLKGEMSIVGPRPHALKSKAGGRYFQNVVSYYGSRHRVKPGITGWAQVNGLRGETDTEEKIIKRVEHDLYYIDNWSLIFDIRIIMQTLFILFKKEDNAY